MFRNIGVQVIRPLGVDGTQMCLIDHCLLQLIGGSLLYSCPLPLEVCLKHRGQRGRHSLDSFDKMLVTSTQPDKLLNFINGGWQRPTSNDLHYGVHVYSIFIDDVSAKGYSSLEEGGFIDAGKRLVSTYWFLYQMQMSLVFLGILGEDEDAVNVHQYENSEVVLKDVDGALQRPEGITTHSKAPNCTLKAIFSTSSPWIRIWWNPLTWSIFEETVETPSVLSMDWIEHKGYRSRTVRVFNAR